jgi:cell filamentation protein
MRDKYGVSQDNYCYANSDVLRNKLNILDYTNLGDAELAFTAIRYNEYSSSISSINTFNLTHLKVLHQHLFQDVFEWAGELRTVDISKGSTRFCTCHRIEQEATKQFSRIPSLINMNSTEELITVIADIFCELNIIHPFRDGNGRTQRFFFEELFFFLGLNIEWPDITKDKWVKANIQGYNGDLKPLVQILTDAIS